MTREPWMQPVDERKKISGSDRRVSIVSGSFPIRTGSKIELQEAGRTLYQEQQSVQQLSEASVMNSDPVTCSKISTSSRHGSMLGSLKAHYRKFRTFKGTVRAIINLKRTPLALANVVKTTAPTPNLRDEQRSAVVEVPRISATAAANVQTQVHKLVAEGHVVAEMDPTSSMEVAYRQQGNLDHYTEVNLAKRVSLQQHPHMIALTQRLWNCALHNGEKNLKFADYETYMLCLHRLILPEFDIGASKELIMDDWKRDSGEQDHLDYAFFHLSMFELVDLWTDTVDPEDYISLLYCITHCLTYLLNERHVLKSLEDIFNVNILEESKGVTQETIERDLQRELNSGEFAYYRDQIKITAEANQHAEEVASGSSRPRRDSSTQQSDNQISSTSRSRDRKRSSSRSGERDGTSANAKDSESAPQHRRSRSGSGVFVQDSPKRKFSVQARTNGLSLTADTSGTKSLSVTTATTNHSTGTNDHFLSGSSITNGGPPRSNAQTYAANMIPVSPRRQTTLQSATSPSTYAPGGVILNIGMLDGTPILMPTADDKPAIAVSTANMAGFPRRRSRSASNTNQHRRDQILQAISGKVDHTREASFSGLQVSQIEAPGSVLRAGTQDPNSPDYAFLAGASSGISRLPFTVRAAAVAEAAANMAMSAAVQRTQHQLQHRTSQYISDGTALSVSGGATKNIPPNIFINNSSLTAPLITIVSSKAPTPHETTPLINKIQLQFQENTDAYPARPQTPYGGLHGASISSPRASNVITAQAAGIFISTQRPVKPPTSPRSIILQSPGSILNTEYQAPMSPRKLQHQENLAMGATGPGSMSTSLAISGRPAAPNNVETSSAGQPPKSEMTTGMVGDLPLVSDGVAAVSHLKDDLKSLLSPRYIVTNPVAPHHPAQISNLKQSSIRPQGSTRGFARKNSPRIRHQPSSLANGPATNHLRQQRHPYELQGLSIESLQLG